MKDFTIQQVLDFLDKDGQNVDFIGKADTTIHCMANIKELKNNSVSWIKKKSFLTEEVEVALQKHKDILIIAPFGVQNSNTIITKEPKRTFFSILNEFFTVKHATGIHSTAVVETEKIGNNVTIGAHCYIGPEVEIGDNVIIHHNVVIENPCVIGEGTEIFSGVVIGTEGFGYYYDANKVPTHEQHYMGVRIGKHVDIGANTTIDRGLLGDTIIGDNVKIDNHCQVAHNVIIRDNVVITGFSGIAGSTEVGKNSYLAPFSNVLNQLKIGEDVYVGAGSLVIRNVKDGKKVFGVPARSIEF